MRTPVEFQHHLGDGMSRSVDFFDFGNAATLHHARVCRFAPRHFGRFAFIGY